MVNRSLLVAACLGLVTLGPAQRLLATPAVHGEYVEARTCDVWTGPCFANGEINLRGDHAVVAWIVSEGTWNGVALDGLKIVAVLDAEGTLHTNAEGKVRAVVFVDDDASEAQAEALLAMATSLAPTHLRSIERVERRDIEYSRRGANASLEVGREAEVKLETEKLSAHCDTICGNESKAYPSVSANSEVQCAKTVKHAYKGEALGGVRWSDPGKRSAMIGHFSL